MKTLREPFSIGDLRVTLVGDEVALVLGAEGTRLSLERVALLRYLLEALGNEARGRYPDLSWRIPGPTVQEILGNFVVRDRHVPKRHQPEERKAQKPRPAPKHPPPWDHPWRQGYGHAGNVSGS